MCVFHMFVACQFLSSDSHRHVYIVPQSLNDIAFLAITHYIS